MYFVEFCQVESTVLSPYFFKFVLRQKRGCTCWKCGQETSSVALIINTAEKPHAFSVICENVMDFHGKYLFYCYIYYTV